MIKFTFNKKARVAALAAIKKLETGSFLSAILGSFSSDPRVTAIASMILFVVCRLCETVIIGVEDVDYHEEPKAKAPEKNKSLREEVRDSG